MKTLDQCLRRSKIKKLTKAFWESGKEKIFRVKFFSLFGTLEGGILRASGGFAP